MGIITGCNDDILLSPVDACWFMVSLRSEKWGFSGTMMELSWDIRNRDMEVS